MPKVTSPFGLRGVTVSDGVTSQDLCAMELSFTPEVSSTDLVCGDCTITNAVVKRWNITAQVGDIHFPALGLMLGRDVASFVDIAGNTADSMTLQSGISFKDGLIFVGHARDGKSDVHYRTRGFQNTSLEGGAAVESWHSLSMTATAKSVEIVSHETAIVPRVTDHQEAYEPAFAYYARLAEDPSAFIPNTGKTSSAGLIQASAAQRPLVGRMNGHDALVFDGIDDEMSDTTASLAAASPMTVLVVFQLSAIPAGAADRLVSGTSATSPLIGYLDELLVGLGSNLAGQGFDSTLRPQVLVVTTADGSSAQVYSNLTPDVGTTALTSSFSGVSGVKVGNNNTSSAPTAFVFSELEIFDQELPASVIRSVIARKSATYGA